MHSLSCHIQVLTDFCQFMIHSFIGGQLQGDLLRIASLLSIRLQVSPFGPNDLAALEHPKLNLLCVFPQISETLLIKVLTTTVGTLLLMEIQHIT